MDVVVFDSDVLIGFLNRDDAHHQRAVERMQAAMTPGTRLLLCAVNYAEVMVGPLRSGTHERVEQALLQLNIETVPADTALSRRAAAVRARSKLKLPDAFALATLLVATHDHLDGGRLETFDARILKAQRELYPPAR